MHPGLTRLPLQNAVDFPARCALLVERHCAALKDFTGESPPPRAIDVGCAVGGATFELTKCGFAGVMGLDYSKAFVLAATAMKETGAQEYCTATEGELTVYGLRVKGVEVGDLRIGAGAVGSGRVWG